MRIGNYALFACVFILIIFFMVGRSFGCGDLSGCGGAHNNLNNSHSTNWFSYTYYWGGHNKPGFWEVMRATPRQRQTAQSGAWSNDFRGQMKTFSPNYGLYSSYWD